VIGAVIGDIIGSVHEFAAPKSTEFPLFHERSFFTDDTVLTIAVADCLLNGGSYVDYFHKYARAYPNRGYGGGFLEWVRSGSRDPYNSWGNGSAMRVSPVGFACEPLEKVLEEATRSAEVTHNHPEGIRGAQATAMAVFLARRGKSKPQIRNEIETRFGYNLQKSVDEIRPGYQFDVSCQGTVPQAITAFLDSTDYENAVRLAISLGGDADTLACIAGGIAEAFYGGVPKHIAQQGMILLDEVLLNVVNQFNDRYGCPTA